MAKDSVETGMISVTKKLGASLLEEAQKANRKTLQDAVVGKVQDLLMRLTKQREYREQCDRNIALLEEKIAAIEAGAFELSPYGSITLSDKDLHAEEVHMAECVNCGMSKTNVRGIR